MMGIFHTNAIALKQLDKMKAKDLGRGHHNEGGGVVGGGGGGGGLQGSKLGSSELVLQALGEYFLNYTILKSFL